MDLDTQLIAAVGGVFIPILVGILAKLNAGASIKSILNAALSAITAAIGEAVPGDFDWKPFIVTWALTFAISIATYYGLWKPTGVAPAVKETTRGFGLGKAD